MKAVIATAVGLFCLTVVPSAHAWNCSDPLASRVPVSSGTTGTFGNGDGQLFLGTGLEGIKGQLYECETPQPPATGGSSNASSTSNSNSSSTSGSTSNSTATGGKSTSRSSATGGSATGGSATTTSVNTVSPVLTAVGGAGGQGGAGGNASQKQGQTQSVSNSGNSSADNVGNTQISENITKVPQQVATAYAPSIVPTVPCFKGFGAGAQTAVFGASFGGGKIDQNCAILETSRQAPNLLARCKVYITDKYAKAAGVTLADCMQVFAPPVIIQTALAPMPTTVTPNVTVDVPAPVVTVIPAPITPAPVSVAAVAKKVGHPHSPCKCVITNDNINTRKP